ncbi:GntR family transcriptional regulator [Klebsiella pneumoniae subsp. pneumoniae]|uniref:GntR family transcriptional regulator n=1 Tax=Klebsiella pneumoniae subsp. pneumoniae TaxID=72407 RepID=A0A378A1B3_KLEPN|nr:GntR family transcriptional regulator [Klebsiella pneumoniae subsp. pneumoniae]
MVKGLLNTVNRRLSHDDAGKLLLRLAVGGLMLFHGIHKLIDGVDGISGMLAAQGLPGFIAYGVLVGEVVAPCLLILGVLTRPAALVLAFTMVVAWLMVGLDKTFALDAVGAWAIENLVYFFVGALAIALLGAGVIRWPVSRPGGKNASFVLGRKVDTVGDLQFFQSGKAFISCRLSVCLLSPGIFPEAAHCAFSGLPNRTAL